MEEKVKRLFLGIPLDENHRSHCQEVSEKNSHVKNIRWTPENNLHITSLFIGDTPESHIPELIRKISLILEGFEPFSLTAERFVFMPPRKPKMIWLRYQKHPEFSRLSLLLAQEILGKDPDHPPKPHVTLARFKRAPAQKISFPEVEAGSMAVSGISLYQSELKPDGARYKRIESFLLK
ncbi:MAG: RNA 2',3'-cyclic phosphodiesterase [Bacteroidota bacterium]